MAGTQRMEFTAIISRIRLFLILFAYHGLYSKELEMYWQYGPGTPGAQLRSASGRSRSRPGPECCDLRFPSLSDVPFPLDPSYNSLSMSQTTQESPANELGRLPAVRIDIGMTYRPSYDSHSHSPVSSLIPLVTQTTPVTRHSRNRIRHPGEARA